MPDTEWPDLRVIVHLAQQTAVTFAAGELWPAFDGDGAGPGAAVSAVAVEVTRRLRTDGYVGYSPDEGTVTVIPGDAVRRIDVTTAG